ncbi:hypothetical protein QR680_017529 [Steinernema hermaphroditum]|uniref:Uncharacterized protein n=1 Tax=Steinernema hermaphroditum TaxID=289476 RepID=A0AA39HG39_9BILA|nr:hypothetical protein QR680_017529 [Steinernema hermaphroditum]
MRITRAAAGRAAADAYLRVRRVFIAPLRKQLDSGSWNRRFCCPSKNAKKISSSSDFVTLVKSSHGKPCSPSRRSCCC